MYSQVTKIFSKKILTKRALREIKLLQHFRGHKNVRQSLVSPLHPSLLILHVRSYVYTIWISYILANLMKVGCQIYSGFCPSRSHDPPVYCYIELMEADLHAIVPPTLLRSYAVTNILRNIDPLRTTPLRCSLSIFHLSNSLRSVVYSYGRCSASGS